MWNVTETLTPNQATANYNKTTAWERSVINYWGLKRDLLRQPRPQSLNGVQNIYYNDSWLVGSHGTL